ncbi:hypothetical protein [Devosia sp. MC521]|uniref:hypothetical protein n=1 Tax=Devosia sp. MC521 TaxID=2759954 RepID=UPI0015FAC233|nr:hypothetical protein [Devosia sp. MC521]MBJ6988966.1 hypothetical protein [Devosia sp. MC521]QMW64399.1 hypothetical protein H4N61_08920 [Devosia sp. MC521]
MTRKERLKRRLSLIFNGHYVHGNGLLELDIDEKAGVDPLSEDDQKNDQKPNRIEMFDVLSLIFARMSSIASDTLVPRSDPNLEGQNNILENGQVDPTGGQGHRMSAQNRLSELHPLPAVYPGYSVQFFVAVHDDPPQS